jgi:uncharacterized membrane protein YtjA (UPF0391 family)
MTALGACRLQTFELHDPQELAPCIEVLPLALRDNSWLRQADPSTAPPGNHHPTLRIQSSTTTPEDLTMLKWALIFLVISIVSGILGFSGVSAATAKIAKILFVLALLLFLAFLIAAFAITGAVL